MMIFFTLNNDETKVSFEYMYNTYKNTVYSMIQKSECDENLYDDIMQEIFIRFYKSMGKVQGKSALRRWLMTIAHNEIINYKKSEKTYRTHILLDLNEEELLDACAKMVRDAVFEAALKKELGFKVREEIHRLNTIYQEVIVLKYYFEYTVNEISYMLDCPLNTVYTRLRKAEEILRNALYNVICEYNEKGGEQQ